MCLIACRVYDFSLTARAKRTVPKAVILEEHCNCYLELLAKDSLILKPLVCIQHIKI